MAFKDSRLGVGTLKIGPADPPVNEFNTQAAAVKLTPSVDSEDGTPTLAVPDPAPLSTISWALNVDAIQDFEEPAGFVNYLQDNALSEQFFEWVPITTDGTKYAGKVQIVPIEIGGDVAVQIVTSVELPVIGEPTRTDGVATMAAEGSSEQESRQVIRLRGTVEYEGGRSEEFETGSAAVAEWELYALRHGYPTGEGAPSMLSALVVAHYALGVAEGFDVWRRSVVGVDLETEGVPPTLPVPTVG